MEEYESMWCYRDSETLVALVDEMKKINKKLSKLLKEKEDGNRQ